LFTAIHCSSIDDCRVDDGNSLSLCESAVNKCVTGIGATSWQVVSGIARRGGVSRKSRRLCRNPKVDLLDRSGLTHSSSTFL
jgi:hypothetical protein